MKKNLLYTLKFAPIVALVTIGLCTLTTFVAQMCGWKLPEQANVRLIRNLASWNPRFIFLILQIAIIMPLIEEVVFRGVLFRWPKPMRLWLTGLTSSALFAGAHYLSQPWPDNAFVALFFFGLAQCYLYRKTDSIWYPVLNHAFFNALNLILLFVLPESFPK